MSVAVNSREVKRCADFIAVRCPVVLRQAVQQASEREGIPASQYVRDALRRRLREDGIELPVELAT
jgi:hypothetical protein